MEKTIALELPGIPVTINIPRERLAGFIDRAKVNYWGYVVSWCPTTLVLEIVEEDNLEDSPDGQDGWKWAPEHLITLMPSDWARGLGVMLEKFPLKFAQIVNDDGDMYTGDLLIQCAAFGEEKYS